MPSCILETCTNEVKGRRYCCPDCKATARQRRENPEPPDIEEYQEVEPELELLKKGAWFLFPFRQSDEKCVGDFVRALKRPPAHVIYDPATPMWKYAGPVWTEEELAWRWKEGDK